MEISAMTLAPMTACFPVIPSPSFVGKSVIVKQAVLLTCGSLRAHTFPRLSSQWHTMGLLPVTVAGPCRHFTGLPY